MMKRLMPIALLAAVFSLAAVACGGGDDDEAAPAAAAPPAAAAAPTADPSAAEPATPAVGGITKREGNEVWVTLQIVGGGGTTGERSSAYGAALFAYEPKELTINVGDTVHFTLIPTRDPAQQHAFFLRTLDVIQNVKYGKTAYLTHTFDQPGDFRWICPPHLGDNESGIIHVQ